MRHETNSSSGMLLGMAGGAALGAVGLMAATQNQRQLRRTGAGCVQFISVHSCLRVTEEAGCVMAVGSAHEDLLAGNTCGRRDDLTDLILGNGRTFKCLGRVDASGQD